MYLSRSVGTLWYRMALFMAFVAMHLLLGGPLISQYQAGGQHHANHGTHHPPSHPSSHHGGGHHQHAAPQASNDHHHHAGQAETVEPIFNWFHQCGYCAVWQQFPTTQALLPAIGQQAFITHERLLSQPAQGTQSCDTYPHALTRAPPFSQPV
ncbi:hypothetical protein ACT3RP_10555 [Halomonas sp. AOP5-B2-8]